VFNGIYELQDVDVSDTNDQVRMCLEYSVDEEKYNFREQVVFYGMVSD